MNKKDEENFCKKMKGLVANLNINTRAPHVVRQSLDDIALKITDAQESGKKYLSFVIFIFIKCCGIESLIKLVEDSEDDDILEETFVLLFNVLPPAIDMWYWHPKKPWIVKHSLLFMKKMFLLRKQNHSVVAAGSKMIELIPFLKIPGKGLFVDTPEAVKELIQSLEHQLDIIKTTKAFDLPPEILMPFLRLFLVLCRNGSWNVRQSNRGVNFLLDLLRHSDPSSSKFLQQLHLLHSEVFLSVVTIENSKWFRQLVKAGVLKILTKKIEDYNQIFKQVQLPKLDQENLSLTECPKNFKTTTDSRCFVMEEAPTHYAGYYDPKNPSEQLNVYPSNTFSIRFEELLNSFIAHEHHLLALLFLTKLIPKFILWPINKTKLMEPILDYLTLTPHPDPVAARLLVHMTLMNWNSAGVVEGNDGTFPVVIYRRLVMGQGFKCRMGTDCRLHSFLRNIGRHVLDCVCEKMKMDVDEFIRRQKIIGRRTTDWIFLTRRLMTIPIISSSLEDVIIFGYNSNSLVETFKLLKNPEHTGDALASLSSLANLIQLDRFLCPPTLKLEDVFKNFGCRASGIEPDVYFDISSQAAVRLRVHINSIETRSYSLRDCTVTEQINQDLLIVKDMIKEIQVPVGACKSLLIKRSQYFQALLDSDFVEGNAGSFENPVVLPNIPVQVLTSILHILYGCGRNCPVIINLETLLRDYSLAVDLLRYLEYFSAGAYVQRISDLAVNQPLDPLDYVGLLVKLGSSISGRQWFRHLLCLPFCTNSMADLNSRWGLLFSIFFSPLSVDKFVVLSNGSEVSVQDFMVKMYVAAFLKCMKLEQHDSEEELLFNLGYYNLEESLPSCQPPLDYETDSNNLILRCEV